MSKVDQIKDHLIEVIEELTGDSRPSKTEWATYVAPFIAGYVDETYELVDVRRMSAAYAATLGLPADYETLAVSTALAAENFFDDYSESVTLEFTESLQCGSGVLVRQFTCEAA